MSGLTRNQEYKYQYRNVAVARSIFCGYGAILTVNIPDNLLELKNLALHVVLQFDVAVPSGNRKLYYIGGTYGVGAAVGSIAAPVNGNMVFVNLTADANRRIDCVIDISHLIPKLTFDSSGTFDQPSFQVSMITNYDLFAATVTGTMELWKADLIYTTKGIQ